LFDTYHNIFNKRGEDYDIAMKKFPYARKNEFIETLGEIDMTEINHILDVPSGGGYLKKKIGNEIDVTEFDPAVKFSQKHKPLKSSKKFDMVYCLATLHHVENKNKFISDSLNLLNNKGYLCIGDVLINSKESVFLDEFVGRYNNMGHDGLYLENNADILSGYASKNGKLVRNQYKECPWVFATEEEMLFFFRTLFSLKSISDEELLVNIDRYLGVVETEGQSISVNFSLLFVTYVNQRSGSEGLDNNVSMPFN